MAEKSFQSITDNSETRMANFLQSVCSNSLSINLIENELSNEKSKRRKLDNDRRELKYKIKELVEKLNATEKLMDISNATIQILEKAMEDSAQQNTTATIPSFLSASKPTGGTGEEEDENVFEERAKLFRYDPTTKEWKERGTGVLKILYLKHSHKYRILMRRDKVLKICANHYILPEMKLEAKSDKLWVWSAQDYSEKELEQQQFAARFKAVDIAKQFQTVFLDCQAKLKETKPKDTVSGSKCKGNSAAFEKLVVESKLNVSEKVTEPQKGKPLSELFKPDAGSWECNVCYVRNKSEDSKCVSCHLTKDTKFEWRNDKSLSWTATDFSENEPSLEILAVRFKTSEYAEEFKKAVDDALKVSNAPAPSRKSESIITLNPSSTFSFKTDGPIKVEPQCFGAGSLSSRFGGSPQQSQTVFGSAATGFSFKDSKVESGASTFSFSLKDNASTGSIFNKPSVFGGFGVAPLENKDDDIEIVYEPTVSEEQIKLAQELQLPKFFFLYKNKPPCPGCIGCEDKIPPYKTTESQASVERNPIPDTNATQQVPLTQESSMPFSSASFSTFSFSYIASDTGFEKLAKSPASGKTAFAGAGTPLFQNLNTPAGEGTDEVAPGPCIHFKPVIPLPDLIEVETGEEDEKPLFIFRAKLFRYDPNTKQWKERGIGNIKILSHKEKMRFRIILRRDQVHNVACNHCITEEMSLTNLSTSENALCWIAMDYSDAKGEPTQFAVRFKHKEQTQQFKEVFLDCQEKLRGCKQTSVSEKEAATAPHARARGACTEPEEPVGASGGASATEESVTEDDEESEELIFEKRTTLEVFDDAENKFRVEGMGCLKIVYDDSSFGYRVFMEADDGRLLCEHLIAVQTCLRTEGKTAVWAAIDYCMEPVTRRQFRVTFSSMEALNEFSKHFEEGKEIAIKSPIVEKSD